MTELRPQTLLLAFLGIHLLGKHVAVSSGSVIGVLAGLGVSEEATRSTLTRMTQRGLLERHRRGRQAYFGLTARSESVLEEGATRMWRTSPVNRGWDGRWTLIGFSLPESWTQQRHDLRSRLMWGGFGPLQNGLWIAPAIVDVPALLADLRLDAHIRAFVAETVKPTEAAQFVGEAFDLDGLAAGYRRFLRVWDRRRPLPELPDDLVRELLLQAEWLQLVRDDPRLPLEHLPDDWPSPQAEEVFHDLAAAFREPAARVAAGSLEFIDLP
ncbi:PaaX family transcriptional regulator [Nonomuraea soli]|uniref:Phenylacetic acid degradation operon negative regulatory protein n=1 Tax=Nonomuraea soli TaxID=1032476 RepID=A0A7W0CHU1_9ACTN|nr:PaaX family transcriptional regulator C-terminal domain-containing protein [Nonomuraea soli]MBA2891435.1 phenylacetic acid degradation operon negative regulatory protein [Nonomuraea soli]